MKSVEYEIDKYFDLDEISQTIIGPNGTEDLTAHEYVILDLLLSKKSKSLIKFEDFMVCPIWGYEKDRIDNDDITAFRTNSFNNHCSRLGKKLENIAKGLRKTFLKNDPQGKRCEYIRIIDRTIEECNGTSEMDDFRKRIAEIYYGQYSRIVLRGNKKEYNAELLDVFCYPRFVDDVKIDFSKEENIYICAPNGFGKSTLLKSFLFASNISENAIVNFKNNINEIRKYYNIDGNYLSLFIDLKNIQEEEISNREGLYEWLLNASGLNYQQGDKIGRKEFKSLIDWYNENQKLIVIFDSFDEIIDKNIRNNVDNVIKALSEANGICSNAKIIMASRPLVMQENDRPYEYLYMDLFKMESDIGKIRYIIGKYAGEYADECYGFIFGDRYLKRFIVTPQLLTEVIIEFLQNKNYEMNQETQSQKSIYEIINAVTQNTILRFRNRGNVTKEGENFKQRPYHHVYEIFSYISLFKNIDNTQGDIEELSELILSNKLSHGGKHKKPLDYSDIDAVYEHFSLLSTQDARLDFVADKVWKPYFLASYMYLFYEYEQDDSILTGKGRWKKFETISDNRIKNEEILYDMLVFYFAKLHDYPFEGAAYDAWIEYVVYKWNDKGTSNTCKEILKDRLTYLLEGKFVSNSRLERIFDDNQDLQDNEIELRKVIESLKNV